MGGRHYGKEDVKQIEVLIEDGLTSKDIAQRLGRPEAGIRNLRYRKGLVRKAEDETKALFQRRDELGDAVKGLEDQYRTLFNSVESLKAEKEKLESIISLDKILLQSALTQALTNLKQQRPDLFILSGQEQLVMLAKLFYEKVLR